MHDEILNADQQKLLPLMAQFRREYYLVGGTAIALHIGHRRSVDFDLFKMSAINHKKNVDKIVAAGFNPQVTRRVAEQMNLLVNGVKLTFFQYPFPVVPEDCFGKVFRMPEIIHGLFAILKKKGAKILLLLFGEACIEVVNQIDVKHNLQILFLYVNMF